MSTNRRIVCEAAFGYTPFQTIPSGDWIELLENGRPRIKEATWSFGRDDELEHFQPGTATILLSNRDRRLDPDNAASPHFGFLLPNVPVRLRSKNEDTGTFEDEFYGFVAGGWEQVLAPNRTGDCRIELVDYLSVLTGYQLPDVFHKAILDLDPVGFWVLDGGNQNDNAEQVADQGTGRNDGSLYGEGVTLGDKVITPGHRPAARFDMEVDEAVDKRRYGAVFLGRSSIVTAYTSALLVATFLARSRPTDDRRILFVQATGSNVDAWTVPGGIEAHIHTDGRLIYGSQTILTGASPKTVVDGNPHIVFANNESLGVDTTTLTGSATVSKSISTVTGAGIGGTQGGRYTRHWDGWIGVVAIFADSATVGTAGRDAIFAAYTKLDGQRSDQHIAWALDQLGVPSGKRNLSAGTVIMGPADTEGKDAVDWMRQVAATEGGGLYVDHRDGGKIRFTDRYHRFLNARSTASQATFSDDPSSGSSAVRYTPEGLQVASNGLNGIVNQVSASWMGGEVVISDDTSIGAYGPRQRTLETVATTANAARSAAEWIVARFAQPRSRIRGATASARHTAQRHDSVQGLKLDDRVTFRVQPLHTGTATTITLYIDGVSHAARGVEWETSFRFAQAETFTPWIWGTSAWNTTAYWG